MSADGPAAVGICAIISISMISVGTIAPMSMKIAFLFIEVQLYVLSITEVRPGFQISAVLHTVNWI